MDPATPDMSQEQIVRATEADPRAPVVVAAPAMMFAPGHPNRQRHCATCGDMIGGREAYPVAIIFPSFALGESHVPSAVSVFVHTEHDRPHPGLLAAKALKAWQFAEGVKRQEWLEQIMPSETNPSVVIHANGAEYTLRWGGETR